MKHSLVCSLLLFAALAGTTAFADELNNDVKTVLDKYAAAFPAEEDLAIYRLDWVPSLDEARRKAATAKRPILLIVVTNSYGNLYTGHC